MEYFECQKYLNSKIEFYEYFLRFIEDESNEIINFQYVVDIIDSHNYQNNTDELKSMLCMIREISGNHHRTPSFFKKFEMFFSHYAECIKNTFTAIELFNIFRKNRRILLILVDIKIIPDKEITELLQKQNFSNLIRYQFDGDLKPNIRLKHNQIGTKETLKQNYKYYFYPEMLPYISKWNKTRYENDLLRIDKNIFDKLDKIRRIGENDSYICQLIRQDSVEEFDTYACKTLLNLGSLITPSIFETNTLLIKKKPSLIEYAAFFGSVKIFNYLRMNEVELKPSLWIYAIHSNKPEIIHILENLEIEPEDESYIECLKESIKCHHNDIARYIRDNLMDQEIKNEIFYFNKNQFSFGFHYHNYSFLEDSQLMQFSLFYACKYDYFPLVKLLINMDEFDVKQSIILNFFSLNETTIYIQKQICSLIMFYISII